MVATILYSVLGTSYCTPYMMRLVPIRHLPRAPRKGELPPPFKQANQRRHVLGQCAGLIIP